MIACWMIDRNHPTCDHAKQSLKPTRVAVECTISPKQQPSSAYEPAAAEAGDWVTKGVPGRGGRAGVCVAALVQPLRETAPARHSAKSQALRSAHDPMLDNCSGVPYQDAWRTHLASCPAQPPAHCTTSPQRTNSNKQYVSIISCVLDFLSAPHGHLFLASFHLHESVSPLFRMIRSLSLTNRSELDARRPPPLSPSIQGARASHTHSPPPWR